MAESGNDLEALFREKVQPFIERIAKLEESQVSKDLEIVTLKHAISNLNSIILELKKQSA